MTSRLEYALQLAEDGFFIHQLLPNSKEPVPGIKWSESRTRDPAVIKLWFELDPENNYGVSGGPDRVIIDADLDPNKNKDGEAALQKLEAEHGQAITWSTFTVQSPKGGKHYYLKGVDHVGNAHSFPHGIDIRGENGYVVGPGCHTEDDGKNTRTGDYVVECPLPVANAPIWTSVYFNRAAKKDADSEKPLGELDTPESIVQARAWLLKRKSAVEGENGDDHTYATAAGIKDFGISELKCMELLVEVPPGQAKSWNEKCNPPWEIEGKVSLSTKIYNAYVHGTNRPGSKGGALMDDAIVALGIPDSVMPSGDDELVSFDTPDADGKTGLDKLAFRGTEFATRPVNLEMVISEWLPAQGLSALLANRSTGKTTVMLDQALRLACDRRWHCLDTAKDWVSIYLCGEGDTWAQLHFQAWLKYHKENHSGTDSHSMEPTDGPAKDRFMMMTGVPNLLDASEVKAWTEYMNAFIGSRRAVIYLDTWQRASAHGSQNDDVVMQAAFHNAEAMARSLKGPIVAAFHPPKHTKDTISGAFVIENNTTTIMHMNLEGEHRNLKIARTKGEGEGRFMVFEFNAVETGDQDQFGRNRKGIVPIMIGGQPRSDPGDAAAQQAALTVTRQKFAEVIAAMIVANEGKALRVDAVAQTLSSSSNDPAYSELKSAKLLSTMPDAIVEAMHTAFSSCSVVGLKGNIQGKLSLGSGQNFESRKFAIDTDKG